MMPTYEEQTKHLLLDVRRAISKAYTRDDERNYGLAKESLHEAGIRLSALEAHLKKEAEPEPEPNGDRSIVGFCSNLKEPKSMGLHVEHDSTGSFRFTIKNPHTGAAMHTWVDHAKTRDLVKYIMDYLK